MESDGGEKSMTREENRVKMAEGERSLSRGKAADGKTEARRNAGRSNGERGAVTTKRLDYAFTNAAVQQV